MKNFKRVLAMTTAAVMAVTSFAGCSSNNETAVMLAAQQT